MIRNEGRMIAMLLMIQVFLLVIQFILGMWINLFAPAINSSLPQPPMGFMMLAMFSVPEIMVHMAIGILIGILSLMIIASSLLRGSRLIAGLAVTNGILTILAGMSGVSFLFGGMQNNALSFTMAIGFIGVVSTNAGMLYVSSWNITPTSSGNTEAMELLRNIYRKGEISKEEYDRMREEIGR
ncbi:MAG: SHOCT domain-containing protein [Candidatus Micrarchaeaceae archaeon]